MLRENLAFTSKYEQKILDYLVVRLPFWITPDSLTLLALLSALVGGVSYLFTNSNPFALLVVNLFLFIHWFGDSLDGRLARFRKQSRPKYGYYVDHILDSVSAAFFIGGLTTSAITDTAVWVWLLALILISMIHVFLKTNMLGVFQLSLEQVGPTEARLGLFLTNLVIFFFGNPRFLILSFPVRLIDIVGFIGFCALLIVLVPDILKTLNKLNKIDKVI